MTWPHPTLDTGRLNTTPAFTNHPADHNALADFANEAGPRIDAATAATVWADLVDAPLDRSTDVSTWHGNVQSFTARRTGMLLQFSVIVNLATGPYTPDAAGNITNLNLCQWPTSWGRAPMPQPLALSGGRNASGYLSTSGVVVLAAVSPGPALASGTAFGVYGTIAI